MNSFVNIQIRILATQAQQRLAQLNQQIGVLNGSWSGAASAVDKFGNAVKGIRLDALGSRIQWIGRQLEYNFTLPIAAAGGAAVKFSLDNQAALTRVTKVYGDAAHGATFYANELNALGRAFEGLSNTFGVAQKETISIAADWAAAGASGLALAKSVKLTMQTMILGEMNASDATKALISIQAQYGQSVDQLTETISILNMVENQTGISLSGLIEGFSRSAGVARSAGVDVRHLAAMLAALTPAAGSAAQAGNALKTIFSRLLSPTEETAQVLALMGINVKDLSWQSSNLVDRLSILSNKFEGLSSSQKNVVSSVIASRWQINKFDILMRELASSTGYYQKALDSTADAQANFTQMQRELNTVLSSNPKRLQIIWTMIQNAMADIIQPAIPLLLYLAQSISRLVSAFSNLDPAVQKIVIALAAFLALIGPAIRYVGASIILIAEMGKFFAMLFRPIGFVTSLLWTLISVPVGAFFRGASVAVLAFGRFVGPFLSTALMAAARGAAVAASALVTIWKLGLTTLSSLMIWFGTFARTAWLALATSVGSTAGYIWYQVLIPIWTKGFGLLRGIIAAGLLGVGAVWRAGLWAMALVTNRIFWVTILGTITNFFKAGLIPLLRAAGTAIVGAITGPWGLAIAAVVTLLVVFWDKIKGAFSGIVNAIKAGWNALPAAIQNALLAVVRTIAAGVAKARELLSYLNPWARHSPSLVDNVTTGVAEIIRQYKLLSNVNQIFARAGVSIKAFSASLVKARQMADALQWKQVREDIANFAPALSGDFNNLFKVLTSLRAQLSGLQAAFPIEQAKAMSDAIFNNSMATKQLQLQLMNMEDAVGPMDKLQGRLDSINGALELAGGKKAELRSAGAGSEILGQYDAQISALEGQRTAIQDQIKPLIAVSDQIAALQRQGDKLDLMNSLQFDPLTRQAEELTAAIQQVESALNDMSQAASSAGNAGKGAMSPGAKNFLDAAGGNFPDVGGFAQVGREGGVADQAAQIDQFTKDLANSTKNMFGMFDFLSPIKKGWNAAWKWLDTNIGPAVSAFWKSLTGSLSSLGNPFGGFSIKTVLDTLKSFGQFVMGLFKDLWTVIGPPLTKVGEVLKGAWMQAVQKIGPELAKFKALLEPIQQLFKELWTVIQPIAVIVGGVLVLAFSILASVFSEVVGPIINFIIDVIAALIKILRGIIEFIVGVFTGDWALAWQGIKDIFGGIWDLIVGIVKGAVGIVWGIIKGVFEGIWNFLKMIWGHIGDTVLGAWNGMISGIKSAWNTFWGWITSAASKIGSLFSWDGITKAFKGFINSIIALWNKLDFGIHFSFTIPKWVPEIGGRTFGVDINDIIPDVGYLAKGGFIARQATAVVGEGRKGYPEYVIPTDPAYRKRALMLFGELGRSLGVRDILDSSFFMNATKQSASVTAKPIQFFASGGTLGSRVIRSSGGGVLVVNEHHTRNFNNYGNLEFPNVKDGQDAEDFLRNLEALMNED